MSGTTCCVSLISWTTPHVLVATFTAILFFPQESNLKYRKDLRKALHLVRQWWKRKHVCLVSRQCVSVGQDCSGNPKKPGEYKRLSSGALGRKNWKIRLVLCSACLGKPRETFRRFWKSLRGACFGKPRVHSKGRSEQKSIQTRWKHLGSIDQLWEDAHFDMDAIYGFIDAGSIAHGPELRNKIWIIQEFWIWEHQFGITRMMIEGNSEIKNVFPADVASSLWEKHVLLKEQAIKWTKAGVYVHSHSVLCLGQQHGQKMQ